MRSRHRRGSGLLRAWSFTLGLAAVVTTFGVGGFAAAGEATVLQGATVVPSPGRSIEGATVIIRDGLIEAVGTDIEVPYDGNVIDAAGLYIYAGFIDAGATLGLAELKHPQGPTESKPIEWRVRSIGFTRAANRKSTYPDLEAASYLTLDAKGGEGHRKAGFTSALIMPGSQIISGQSALVNLSGAPRRDAVLASPVAMHAAYRGRGSGYPQALMAVMAHLRQVFLDAERHRSLKAQYADRASGMTRPPFDPALDSLAPVLDGSRPIAFEASSSLAIERTLGLAAEFGLSVIIAGGGEAWKLADRLALSKTPVLLRFDFGSEPKPAKEKKEEKKEAAEEKPWSELAPKDRFATPERVLDERQARWLDTARGAATLAKHGVSFAFSSGSRKPADVMKQLNRAMEEGLSSDDALRALTETPARLFGVERELGTVEAGKIANLTILNEPLGTEKNTVAYVFVDGEEFEIAGKKKGKNEKPLGHGPGILVSGTWNVSTTNDFGTQEFTWELEEKDGKVTGTMKGRMGDLPLDSGTIEGDSLTLTFTLPFGDDPVELTFKGVIEGASASGTAKSSFGDGTWSATREPDWREEKCCDHHNP